MKQTEKKYEDKCLEELTLKYVYGSLLSGSNKKMIKGQNFGWNTFGLSLMPFTFGGGFNLCPEATKECSDSCIVFSGNARFEAVNQGRYDRTRLFLKNRVAFLELINAELIKLNVIGKVMGIKIAVRLNVFSDLAWEKFIDMSQYDFIQFYDYTKIKKRMSKYLDGGLPNNYHLTFSFSGDNWDFCKEILNKKGNVAIVFDKLPTEYNGFEVINGDESDLTFLHPKGTILGLRYKRKSTKGANNDITNNKFIIKTK